MHGSGNPLFSGMFARGAVAPAVSAEAWLRALLDVEAGLARAAARAGLVTAEAAALVADAARPEHFDLEQLGAASAQAGNPVPALVEQLRARLPESARTAVHLGATSQDIMDSALMLLAARAAPLLAEDLAAAAESAASLAERHRADIMLGRTLLQQALPISFGLKAAGWLSGLDQARAQLARTLRARTQLQFGGAAGTLAALGERGPELVRLLAHELGLNAPDLPWHTLRLPLFELAAALAGASSVLGKIARDISLLAQSEVAELREGAVPGRGGSSSMPQKQNPVGALAVLACTRRVPGLLATLLAAAEQEHERAAGAWHSEWEPFAELLRLCGSAAAWTRELLGGLQVDSARMRSNYDAAGGFALAERIRGLLTPALGPSEAHAFVKDAVQRARSAGRALGETLLQDPALASVLGRAGVSPAQVAQALDPAGYLGSTQTWIERALAAHAALREPTDEPR